MTAIESPDLPFEIKVSNEVANIYLKLGKLYHSEAPLYSPDRLKKIFYMPSNMVPNLHLQNQDI